MPTDYQGERKAGPIANAVIAVITDKLVKKIGESGKKGIEFSAFKENAVISNLIRISAKSFL
jgi:hypothetical protein